MKIFIVEDSSLVQARVGLMLKGISGVEIAGFARDSDRAIEMIHRCRPDVVILDINLSKGSGIDVLKNIKESMPETVVIVLTNYPFPHYEKKCMDLGADYFFDKSIDFNRLPEIIARQGVH